MFMVNSSWASSFNAYGTATLVISLVYLLPVAICMPPSKVIGPSRVGLSAPTAVIPDTVSTAIVYESLIELMKRAIPCPATPPPSISSTITPPTG